MELLIVQWLGAIAGVTGSYFVGGQTRRERLLGFTLFLFSNVFWILVSIKLSTWGLLAMNLAFMVTSVRGCISNHPRVS